jgi:hypothetical protein
VRTALEPIRRAVGLRQQPRAPAAAAVWGQSRARRRPHADRGRGAWDAAGAVGVHRESAPEQRRSAWTRRAPAEAKGQAWTRAAAERALGLWRIRFEGGEGNAKNFFLERATHCLHRTTRRRRSRTGSAKEMASASASQSEIVAQEVAHPGLMYNERCNSCSL